MSYTAPSRSPGVGLAQKKRVRIVIEEIRGEIKVTSLWRREDIASNVYYKWLKDFMEAGKGRLEGATL